MANILDARYAKCEQRIQDALLELLSAKPLTQISVSELAREAHVSRATFYAHYENVGDVFDQLVQQVMSNVQTFDERFSCDGGSCKNRSQSTYCEQIRSNDQWANVTQDPRFFSSMMGLPDESEPPCHDSANLGISKNALEALRLFQMSGCHAIATSKFAKQDDWPQIRDMIDAFIDGGLDAIRSRKTRA